MKPKNKAISTIVAVTVALAILVAFSSTSAAQTSPNPTFITSNVTGDPATDITIGWERNPGIGAQSGTDAIYVTTTAQTRDYAMVGIPTNFTLTANTEISYWGYTVSGDVLAPDEIWLEFENGTVIGNTGPQGTVSQWDEWTLSDSSNWYDPQTLQPVAIANFYTHTVVAVFLGAGSPTSPTGVDVDVYLDNLTIDETGDGTPEYTLDDDTGTIEVLCGTFCGITGCTSIQVGIDAALSGDTINVAAGTYYEVGQIVIDKNLTIIGADKVTTIIKPDHDTTVAGYVQSDAWIYVPSGVTFALSEVTLDGTDLTGTPRIIRHAIQSRGELTVEDCTIKNIETNNIYYGRGIVLLAGTSNTIARTEFSDIQRIGIHVRGNVEPTDPIAYIEDCTYTGKGDGDWLDYGIEFGGGGSGTVDGCDISACTGVATVDGSTSAGILATDYWGTGTVVTVENSTLTGNSDGISVGYATGDATVLTAHCNNISGNTVYGIRNVGTVEVNAENNWWGDASGPSGEGPGSGDAVNTSVDYSPWWGANYVGDDHASAWTWHTDDSIQDAIDVASAGDTIIVAAGTYTDDIWNSTLGIPAGYRINKSVTLLGAQAGNDPAGSADRGGESILVRTNGLPYSITAPNVTIDGFMNGNSSANSGGRFIIGDDADNTTIRNCIIKNTPSASSGHGVYIYSGAENALVEYNTFYNTAWEAIASGGGSGSAWPSASNAVISHNHISASGVHAIQWMGHGGGDNEITYNHISGVSGVNAIQYWGGPRATISHNVIVGGNTMYDGIWLDDAADDSTVSHNQISDTIYAGINIRGGCTGATIICNDISNCGTGVEKHSGDATGVTVNGNSIHGNSAGVTNYDPTTINAENNWWGNASGPGGNGPGTGDSVSANVDYDPWLTAAPPCEVESSNATGATWNTFQVGDSVYIYGSGYSASTSYNLSVVVDTTWTDGMLIPTGEVGTATTVYTDSTGAIAYSDIGGFGTSPALIWTSAAVGDYDIVVDVNGNGYYDSCMDALDDKDVGDAGFNTLPKDCTPEIEVNKTVWDPVTEDWVEEITANVSEIVRFKIWIHNNGTCCNLSSIVVNDTLSESLEYADNATVNGLLCEPEEIVTVGNSTVVRWFYNASRSCTDPFDGSLEYCQNITIEFDAHKILGTVDTNCANVSAWCDSVPSAWVFDEDCVTVNPAPTLNITLNPDDTVTLNWTSSCSLFDIYVTDNLTAGFAAVPNVTVSVMSWTDMNSPSYAMRYYKVMCNTTGKQIDGNVTKILYELKKVGASSANWITMPSTNPPITDADAMIKSTPNLVPGDNVQWWNSTTQKTESYTKTGGTPPYYGDNFPVEPARGYAVTVSSNTNWIVVGWVPHRCQIELKKSSNFGWNWVGMPFDTTAGDADAMIKSIPNLVPGDNVQWWNSTTQKTESYTKTGGTPPYWGDNFPVEPARGYAVTVSSNTNWTPP